MAKKAGDYGMLGLTENQKSSAEFMGINKSEWDKQPGKSWGEKFKDGYNFAKTKISEGKAYASQKLENFKQRNDLITIDFGRHEKPQKSENNFTEADRQELHGNLAKLAEAKTENYSAVGKVEVGPTIYIKNGKETMMSSRSDKYQNLEDKTPWKLDQAQYDQNGNKVEAEVSGNADQRKPDGEVILAAKEITEKPVEEASAETQKQLETLKQQIEGASETENPGETFIVKAENLKDQYELQIAQIEANMEAVNGEQEKLAEQVVEMKQKLEEIKQKMQEKGVNKDNVVDFQAYKDAKENQKEDSGELDIESQELEGDKAVEKSLERYGFMFLQNKEGLQWLKDKFASGEKNNADVTVALSVMRQYKADRDANSAGSDLGSLEEDHVVSKAIVHLESLVVEEDASKQPENNIGDWVELQARLRKEGEDPNQELLGIATRLSKVDTGDVNTMFDKDMLQEGQHALERLRKDKEFYGQFDVDTIAQMADQWKKMQKRLDEKSPANQAGLDAEKLAA